MKFNKSLLMALTLLAVFALEFALPACRGGYSRRQTETLTIGVPALEQNALIYVANARRFFGQNGLRVIVKDYDSGVAALEALYKGEVDVAEASEFPVAGALLQKQPIDIITSNDKFENDYIVGRRDRGIGNIPDLKGKRVGVAFHTIAEFYLGRFLDLHNMSIRDVTLVDVRPAQFVDAISAGDVDAIVAWQPFVDRITRAQGSSVVVWPAQSSQAAYGVLVSNSNWVGQHQSTVNRFLTALAQAQDYIVHHDEESEDIVESLLKYDEPYMESIWPKHQFRLSLDQDLITAMKDEARWLIINNRTTVKQIPDFSKNVYVEGLKSVKPDAVSIIR